MKFSSVIIFCILTLGLVIRQSEEYCDNKNLFACESCPDHVTCTECKTTYGLDPPDGSQGCKPCHPSCGDCHTCNQCLYCVNSNEGPSRSDSYGSCAECGDNCLSCTVNGAGRCDEGSCDEGFGLDQDTLTCKPCADRNCLDCSFDVDSCITCKKNYFVNTCGDCLHKTYKQSTRYDCEIKKYLKKSGSIDTTSYCPNLPNCETCTTDGLLCTKCMKTYGLDTQIPNNGCKQCGKNCALCDDCYQCKVCASTSYGPAANGTCLPCAPNCNSCKYSGAGYCDDDQCQPNYYHSSSLKKCVVGSSNS